MVLPTVCFPPAAGLTGGLRGGVTGGLFLLLQDSLEGCEVVLPVVCSPAAGLAGGLRGGVTRVIGLFPSCWPHWRAVRWCYLDLFLLLQASLEGCEVVLPVVCSHAAGLAGGLRGGVTGGLFPLLQASLEGCEVVLPVVCSPAAGFAGGLRGGGDPGRCAAEAGHDPR